MQSKPVHLCVLGFPPSYKGAGLNLPQEGKKGLSYAHFFLWCEMFQKYRMCMQIACNNFLMH